TASCGIVEKLLSFPREIERKSASPMAVDGALVLCRREGGKHGCLLPRIGFLVIAAIETQRSVAEGSVDEGAVMRLQRIRMDIGPEEPAAETQALRLDR